MAEEDEDVEVNGDGGRGGGHGRQSKQQKDFGEAAGASSAGSSSASIASIGRVSGRLTRRRDEEEGSESGATQALSELFIPLGQRGRKNDLRHHHQFVAQETLSRNAGKGPAPRHCDIAGHQHRECSCCNRGGDEDDENEGVQVVRTLSVRKAIRLIAPAGTVEGKQASSVGERLLLSTAPAGAMDGLQGRAGRGGRGFNSESSDWGPSPRHPSASFSSEQTHSVRAASNRRPANRRLRQKTKKASFDYDRTYDSATNEDRSESSSEPAFSPGTILDNLRPCYIDVHSDKPRGFVSGMGYVTLRIRLSNEVNLNKSFES